MMEVKQIISEVLKNNDIENCIWVAAGGSNGGFYPAQYFMEHSAKKLQSHSYTSNEFVYAPPVFVGENTLAVFCSMRGTPETIEAAKVAKSLGATTIGLYVNESELTEVCDYKVQYESIAVDESKTENVNSSYGLRIAIELLNQTEGYQYYNQAMNAYEKVDSLYRKAVEKMTPIAKEWAIQNKDEKCIYVMGSGPQMGAAYIFSICNVMEMLQIASPTVNSCEFFHGPFEILTKETSLFVLKGVGRVRKADERVETFVNKYGGDKVFMLDGEDLGLNELDENVREYFNHILFAPILNNVYMRQLSYQTKKDYNTRTYMWQVEY